MEFSVVMALLLGVLLGAGFLALGRFVVRKERLFLAVGVVVIAVIYLGFAVAGGAGTSWILIELAGVTLNAVLAWLGLRRSALWLAAGWAAHPVWDIGLHYVGGGAAFTSPWYAVSCVSFDLLVAAYIVVRFKDRPTENS